MNANEKALLDVQGLINEMDNASIRKTEGKASFKIFVDCTVERNDVRESLEKKIKGKLKLIHKRTVVPGHSEEATEIVGKNIKIIYKNKKGGMSETTLNASITELFPCIAFLTGINEKDPLKFYHKVVENNDKKLSCYVNDRDAKAGKEFIDSAVHSSKFIEKTRNAIAILEFLKKQHKRKSISNVFWGYRAKPTGVMANHPGDIFIYFKNRDILGVSLKAGGESTQEPKLNTYVNPIMEFLNKKDEYEKWKKHSYKTYYKGIPNIPNFSNYGKADMVAATAKLEKENSSLYNKLYDEQLEWIRDNLINVFNDSKKETKKWLLEKVAAVQESIPLIVVKAFGDETKMLNDDDIVVEAVSTSSKINAYKSSSSKQNFFIDIFSKKSTDTVKLNFSIRTNKSGTGHKLGQFINLSVKFNGVA